MYCKNRYRSLSKRFIDICKWYFLQILHWNRISCISTNFPNKSILVMMGIIINLSADGVSPLSWFPNWFTALFPLYWRSHLQLLYNCYIVLIILILIRSIPWSFLSDSGRESLHPHFKSILGLYTNPKKIINSTWNYFIVCKQIIWFWL